MNPRPKHITNKVFMISMLVLVAYSSTNQIVSAYTPTETINLIQTADHVIIEIFQVILEAEKAGADTSDILKKLDSVANALNEEKLDLEDGVSEQLIAEIETNISMINELSREASQLRSSALIEQDNAIRSKIIYSVFGVTLLIGIMFRLWVYTKTSYLNRILKSKPEDTMNG